MSDKNIKEANIILEGLLAEVSAAIDTNHELGFLLTNQYRKIQLALNYINNRVDADMEEFRSEVYKRDKRE